MIWKRVIAFSFLAFLFHLLMGCAGGWNSAVTIDKNHAAAHPPVQSMLDEMTQDRAFAVVSPYIIATLKYGRLGQGGRIDDINVYAWGFTWDIYQVDKKTRELIEKVLTGATSSDINIETVNGAFASITWKRPGIKTVTVDGKRITTLGDLRGSRRFNFADVDLIRTVGMHSPRLSVAYGIDLVRSAIDGTRINNNGTYFSMIGPTKCSRWNIKIGVPCGRTKEETIRLEQELTAALLFLCPNAR